MQSEFCTDIQQGVLCSHYLVKYDSSVNKLIFRMKGVRSSYYKINIYFRQEICIYLYNWLLLLLHLLLIKLLFITFMDVMVHTIKNTEAVITFARRITHHRLKRVAVEFCIRK